jgi:phospholipase/carboxylesterase
MNLQWNRLIPRHRAGDSPAIILSHGFGANMYDLASLAPETGISADWLFPQAPVELQSGSYAWFPSDRASLEEVFRGGYFDRIETLEPGELDRRSDELVADIEQLGVDFENCFLGGFSQGSMIAVHAWMRHRLRLRGLIIMSGSLVAAKTSAGLAASAPKVPLFQSHGELDQVLPLQGALNLNNLLKEAGHAVELHRFQGAHGIPADIIRSLASFIGDRLR